jgi:hypothetical protein
MVYSYETTETKKVLKQIFSESVYAGLDLTEALVGKRITAFRPPKKGECFVMMGGKAAKASEDFYKESPGYIAVPDNDYNKFLEDIKIPEGYELDGKGLAEAFRTPGPGDIFISIATLNPFPATQGNSWYGARIIIRKIKKTERFLVAKWKIVPDCVVPRFGEVAESMANKGLYPNYSIVEEEVPCS